MTELRDSMKSGVVKGLEALRDELADSVVETDSAHGKSALARVLLDTVSALEERAEPESAERTGLDEFTERLNAKRRAGAAASG